MSAFLSLFVHCNSSFRPLCQQGRKNRLATHRSHEARTANADVSIRRPDGRCERSPVLRKRPFMSPPERGRSDALFPQGACCNGVVCCGFGAQTITGRGRLRTVLYRQASCSELRNSELAIAGHWLKNAAPLIGVAWFRKTRLISGYRQSRGYARHRCASKAGETVAWVIIAITL